MRREIDVGYPRHKRGRLCPRLDTISDGGYSDVMGRPPLRRDAFVNKRTVWLHDQQVARITALYGSQGLSHFVRKAIDAQLKIEEAQVREALKPKHLGTVEDLFEDE